jgi:Fic family protein
MDTTRFGQSPIGDLVPIRGVDGRTREEYTHVAFAAHPLQGAPQLSTEAWNAVTEASYAIGKLQQGVNLVPNPGLLRRPTLRREAQSTSALEGTFAPIEDVLVADVLERNTRSSAVSEVLNYVDAAERAFAWIDEGRPVTVGLMCELHKVLVRGTAADNEDAGRVRRMLVAIGSRGGSVYEARFVPMPNGPALEAGFQDLVDWMRPDGHPGISPVVAAAMSHYQFETLHPYNDGNGRLGRLLIVLQLVTDGVLDLGLLSVSPWFEKRREHYQELLSEVSATGDWSAWVTFFAQGLQASANEAADTLRALLDVQAKNQETVRTNGARGVIRDIVDMLTGTPYVTIPMLAASTGKTYQAVSTAVYRLVELKILDELSFVGAGSGTKIFVAREVARVTTGEARRS